MGMRIMGPYGLALLDYFRGEVSVAISVCRDDGLVEVLPCAAFRGAMV